MTVVQINEAETDDRKGDCGKVSVTQKLVKCHRYETSSKLTDESKTKL